MYVYLMLQEYMLRFPDEMISEHQAPTRGVYSSLITRRYELMQEFEKKTERYKELLLQEMVELLQLYLVLLKLPVCLDCLLHIVLISS